MFFLYPYGFFSIFRILDGTSTINTLNIWTFVHLWLQVYNSKCPYNADVAKSTAWVANSADPDQRSTHTWVYNVYLDTLDLVFRVIMVFPIYMYGIHMQNWVLLPFFFQNKSFWAKYLMKMNIHHLAYHMYITTCRQSH